MRDSGRSFRGYGLGLACALVVVGIVGLYGADTDAGAILTAPLKIKGVRWVDGVKGKVKCSSGHTVGLELDRRTLTLAPGDPKCPIVADAVSLVFEGTEDVVIARGKERSQRTLVGIEIQTAEINGAMNALLSLNRDGSPKKEKGTIAYLIDDGGPVVVFLGSYTAGKF